MASWRMALRITQATAARLLGVHCGTVLRWETGQTDPSTAHGRLALPPEIRVRMRVVLREQRQRVRAENAAKTELERWRDSRAHPDDSE